MENLIREKNGNIFHYQKRTFWNVIKEKILDNFEKMKLKKISWIFLKSWIFIFWIVFITNFEKTIKSIKYLIWINDFILIKILIMWILIFFYEEILEKTKKIKFKRKEKEKEIKNQIEWIDKIKILEYLTDKKDFQKKEVMKIFWITRTTFEKLLFKLEKLEIFERWEKNKRILKKLNAKELFEIIFDKKEKNKRIGNKLIFNYSSHKNLENFKIWKLA